MKQALVLLSIAVAIAGASEPDSAEPSRWAGPPGSRPGTYQEWIQQHPRDSSPGGLKLVSHTGQADDPHVALYVDSVHLDGLWSPLQDLEDDLVAEGFGVDLYSVRRGTPAAELRDTIRSYWQQYDLGNRGDASPIISQTPVNRQTSLSRTVVLAE